MDGAGHLQHLVFRSDYAEHKQFPGAVVDTAKRFRVGAGVNTHDYRERAPALVEAGADVLCLDSSDGYSDWQAEALRWVKREFPDVPIGGGNVVDGEAFRFLADAGADFVMTGRYFARFDQSPGKKVRIGGSVFKEYWGEGSGRARNWQRYDQGEDKLHFEEGVDGYVPYVGDLGDTLALTVAKIKATMASCGAATIPTFQATARVTLVSEQSYQENTAAVAVRDNADTTLD
ncbi:IMP dehydrogenase [Actinosynnema sp. CS-041913]|uniref:IMP dehydrogenase n=1 Tax=Actinosynnema sp. CS-041913 TaxID=3239917 RepID=UPI003D91A5EC